ncbi:hypothetical protein [Flavivirga rizhaonensis]|nr:hypothetical protein [Flavivirga rizhaonensis]
MPDIIPIDTLLGFTTLDFPVVGLDLLVLWHSNFHLNLQNYILLGR